MSNIATDPIDRSIEFVLDGETVTVPDAGESLLAVLRERLGVTSVKDGCSPQGQCGCCTVLVDGAPRVACVTPARRVRGREITTLDGLDPDRRIRWAEAFCAAGGSQCGFCTPGIIMRLDPLVPGPGDDAEAPSTADVDQALLAHLCRCTGWQTIREAAELFVTGGSGVTGERNLAEAAQRAAIEGRCRQDVSPDVALGRGGFAADTAPDDALVAVFDGVGAWVVGETLTEARAAVGKVQGRRTTASHGWPIEIPDGEWAASFRTTWVDPAYLETDASWCLPGGEPTSSMANGGAFGAKPVEGPAPAGALDVRAVARRLADEHGRAVVALASREDVARNAPKRPPVAGGARPDGSGVLRVAATPGVAEAVALVAPELTVEELSVVGPPTSAAVRAAGWAEAVVLQAGARGAVGVVRSPDGAEAEAAIEDGVIKVVVRCGPPLDDAVLRSYCIGAAHMAWSWLTGEALTVGPDGTVQDLTVRSFGVLRAMDTPPIEVELDQASSVSARLHLPVNGSDAVFAAVAAAGWLHLDRQPDWPVVSASSPCI